MAASKFRLVPVCLVIVPALAALTLASPANAASAARGTAASTSGRPAIHTQANPGGRKPLPLVPQATLREVARPGVLKVKVVRETASPRAATTQSPAATPAPPFTECPAVGADTSCGILVQITDTANNIYADPTQGPYDGSDDTLVGVLNNSSDTISTVALSSTTPIFAFDGDGLCTYLPSPPCPYGPTGYEGPGTSFSNIDGSQDGGLVNFSPGLPPGGTAYFSLENPISQPTVVAGGPSLAEQGGPVNLSENPTTCSTAEPVNCATGVFWHQFTDFSVPGRGVPLSLTRTYSSSQASVTGPFGFGWSFSYGMSLATDTSGDVTITQEDGSQVTFQPDGSGGFIPPPRVLATLTANSDGSYTFVRDQGQIQYNFNSAGQLVSEVDLNGYQTVLSYNTAGQLVTVTEPGGRTLTFTYNGTNIASVTDPMGHEWTYAYDSAGDLTSATDPMGRTWKFTYDANHQMLTMTDPRGGTTTNVYNSSSQVTSQTDPAGRTTTWSYTGDPTSSAGGTTTMTDPNGDVTVYNYADLELTSVTHAYGTAAAATTSYTYDPATLGVATVTDPNGNTTLNTYDSNGNLLSTTDPLGNTTSYTYNGLNEVLTKTTPNDETASYSYDTAGNLLSVTDPNGNTTTYAYGDATHPGDVISVTNPDSDITSYTYDADGNVSSVSTSPSTGVADTTTYAYDADGERTCQASPNATAAGIACPAAGSPAKPGTTATAYDKDGEVTLITDPDGHVTTYDYDADGNVVSTTNPAGRVTTYTFDADNEQTRVTRPDGTTETTTFDGDGNVTSQANGAGDKTTYAYDALNQEVSATDPLGRTTKYSYDLDGNRLTLTDPPGRATTYTYDADSRVTGISYSDGVTPSVSYTYDPDGRWSSMTDGTGTTSYTYDANGHLTSVSNGAGATVGYAYDPAGLLTSVTYPNGQVVTRTYDGAGRLATVTDWLGNKTAFSYDSNGNLTSEAYPNGVTATSAFDAANQITSITDKAGTTTLAAFNYTRDSLGQVSSATTTGAVAGTQSYSYTQISELASDSAGSYGYDQAGDLTAMPGGVTQTYDAAGELTAQSKPGSGPKPATADAVVSANETTKAAALNSAAFSTKSASELVVAFISANGPKKKAQSITGVTGGSLTWKRAARADAKQGTAEVWEARTTKILKAVKVKAKLRFKGYNGSITIASFTGTGGVLGAHAIASKSSGAPAVTLATTGPDSQVWAAGEDPSHATARKAAAGQVVVHQLLDKKGRSTAWTQKLPVVPVKGTKVTVKDTAPVKDAWNLAAVEITGAVSGPVGTVYGYDKNGNRISVSTSGQPALHLTYDQAGRLTGDGTTASYAYGGNGLRMSKTVGTTTTQFAWDQSGSLPLVIAAGSTYYVYGPGNQPIEQIAGTTPTYLLDDQQGSTRLLTNSAGSVVGTYTYGSYGAVVSHTGTATTALQFDGQYSDAESGFLYLQARYYDPATGQFLSLDPAVSLTSEAYGFAADNPVNAVDPSGLSWWKTADEWLQGGVEVAGLVVGVAAAVTAAPELIGAGIVLVGVGGLLELADSADTCDSDGWGSSNCSKSITKSNLDTLFGAVLARFTPDSLTKGRVGVGTAIGSFLASLGFGAGTSYVFRPTYPSPCS